MNLFLKVNIRLLMLLTLILSGCSSMPSKQNKVVFKQAPQLRANQLAQLQQWKVIGKIAFFESKNRNSASLNWQVDENNKTQRLNLTTYLGINLLQLDSIDDIHTIQVDGKSYQGNDLEALILSLTGLTLPTQALTYWLKGLPYHKTDDIIYQDETQLPQTLTSYYNNEQWQVSYGNYQQIDNYSLATKFSIKKDNLFLAESFEFQKK